MLPRASSCHVDADFNRFGAFFLPVCRTVRPTGRIGSVRRMGACKTALVTVVAAVTLGLAPNANADAVSRYFGARSKQARCIVGHESSGNPHAISPTGDYGLFQVNYRTWRGRVASFYEHGRGVWIRLPYTLDTFKRLTLKPLYNSRVAWAISHGGTDWSPWSSYSVHGFCREGA